ncbi:GFA family protein [Hyalangium versicolor]|uniref:GFA family protein n=1 Tax=Hyalangium versicolor TaxID=2861190 RepID=UPI001CCDA840|nr:GFA family protein [Hyalangium versicolor]
MATTLVQCLCGAVQLELTGEPIAQLYCHCDDCQAVHGAAYVPAVMYRIPATRLVRGELGMCKRKVTPRTSCRECGTRMFAEPPGLGIRGVTALLLPPGMFKPTFHMQCQHALLPIKDGLPHFKGFPAAFGGSDEQVDW